MQCMDGLLTELEVLRDMINSYNAHSGLMQPKLTPNQYLGVFMTHSGTEGLKMNVCVLISGIFLMLQTCTAMAEEASTAPVDDSYARSIVEKADLVRFPSEGFQVDIVINTSQPDKQVEMRKYRVLQKGNENTVVMVTEPASERGQIILMKGRDLWVFMPEVSQPVRISLAQRLTGQVANGDLALSLIHISEPTRPY